jgi:hypothetical protein
VSRVSAAVGRRSSGRASFVPQSQQISSGPTPNFTYGHV